MEKLTKTIAVTMLLCMAFTLARSVHDRYINQSSNEMTGLSVNQMHPCGYEMCWDDCTASGIEFNY